MLQISSNLSRVMVAETISKNGNFSGGMEPETNSRNGARSKSMVIRGDFLRKVCVALLISSAICFGCKKSQESPFLSVDPSYIYFGANETSAQYITVNTNDPNWFFHVTTGGWLKVTKQGSYTLKVEPYSSNTSTFQLDNRIDICTSGRTLEVSVSVTQEAVPETSLSAPTNVTAVQSGSTIIISWNAVSGATGYRVYRWFDSSQSWELMGSTNNTSYTDNSPYYTNWNNWYCVEAINSTGISDKSNWVEIYFSSGGGGNGGGNGGGTFNCNTLQLAYTSAKNNLKSAEEQYERLSNSGSPLAITVYYQIIQIREQIATVERQARENGCTLR
jgi:hypothetical protein